MSAGVSSTSKSCIATCISTNDCQREGTTKSPFCVTKGRKEKKTKGVVNKRNKENQQVPGIMCGHPFTILNMLLC